MTISYPSLYVCVCIGMNKILHTLLDGWACASAHAPDVLARHAYEGCAVACT